MITGDAGVSTIAHTQLQVDGMEREWRAGTLLALPGVKLFFPCLLRPRVEELINQSCTGYRGGCTCVSPSLVIRPRPNRAQVECSAAFNNFQLYPKHPTHSSSTRTGRVHPSDWLWLQLEAHRILRRKCHEMRLGEMADAHTLRKRPGTDDSDGWLADHVIW